MKLRLTQDEKDAVFREYQPQIRECFRRGDACGDWKERERLYQMADYLAFEATEQKHPWMAWVLPAMVGMGIVAFVVSFVLYYLQVWLAA